MKHGYQKISRFWAQDIKKINLLLKSEPACMGLSNFLGIKRTTCNGKNRMKCGKHDGAALEILLGVQINEEI